MPMPMRQKPPKSSAARPSDGPSQRPAMVPMKAIENVAIPIAVAAVRMSTLMNASVTRPP